MKHLLLALALVAACNKADDQKALKEMSIAVKKYAFEAFPQWAAAHVDKECPTSLTELDQYIPGASHDDAWGTPLRMMCGKDLPAGARGLAVMSFGPDKKEGTADDIKSW